MGSVQSIRLHRRYIMMKRRLENIPRTLPEDQSAFLLDIGCGSGLSGEVLTENGHSWIGIDISQAMLNVAQERESEGGLLLGDIVLQCYPENSMQLDLLQTEAIRAGFTGGIVVDFPNSTRAKKYFMVLDVGVVRAVPKARINENDANMVPMMPTVEQRRRAHAELRNARMQGRCPKKSVAWIKHKKELARRRMKDVAHDSKYTGRKRRPRF
ncbi:putative 18S rRNA guanine-N 7 methyltransferase [Taenia crassiceps]|uniref:18S rRNA guanine-N 7 methyltransferase n=1 Tax=Taenia crassiceps TaxID=6207 RepID=A0ABR4QJ51_9CEST